MIREGVAEVLKELLNIEEIPFNVPPQREMGDFSSPVCLSIAKQRKESPIKIAQELAERLRSNFPPYVNEIGVSSPGYLNFKVDWPSLAQDLIPKILEGGRSFGKPVSPPTHKVFIEHTSVNPNKAMHIGHLRNSVLGDTVARVLEWLGYSTEVCNYIDDTGLQVV
ncbi:MAG TPA: arginine--tRNA ligase, partial [Thermodesulfobacteriota bacterium]|nr:arginine--tRNA ligase [Thermodesulfobacteriota bacterium]